MSDAPATSEFATARTSLRETIKWLVGIGAALGAVLAAGISFTALGALKGFDLGLALVLGLVALCAMMLALKTLLDVLLVRTFTLRDVLKSPRRLDQIAESGILPLNFDTLPKLVENRDKCLARLRINADDRAAKATLAISQKEIGKAVDYAAFQDLSDQVKAAIHHLALWVAVIVLATAGIGLLIGRDGGEKETPAAAGSTTIQTICDGVTLGAVNLTGGGSQTRLQLSLPADCLQLTIETTKPD